ncbi:SDR family oxidoreductase [Sphingomonas sp. BK069]|uniref:SDR family oxidoreductase n=1 Tax=Sphingomonas sp. BK069 TaxID=2586979 RepID=UPI00161060B8|nr:SDR family NAD(P)-dependent oxidoreductase [Sphingomonas sp. BK069]MBB3349105.1 NADP-dependent 3-hydroxy acid dehydrogenase YdfG [Sphingomonas sp. BK069]
MKTAIVTAATSGIGEATTRALVRAGWQVIATGRRAERLERLAAEHGGRVHIAVFDVTDPAALDHALDSLPDGFGGIAGRRE